MTSLAFFAVTAMCLAALLFAPFARAAAWRATVTPLASIMGSGFLVSAPILAGEVGGLAAPAMLTLIVFAYLIGAAMRHNIRHVEPLLGTQADRMTRSLERLSHVVLAIAYFISVAYYLALLGNFVLQALGRPSSELARLIASALLALIGWLGFGGGVGRVASVERYATALNLSVIAGLLAALAVYGVGLWREAGAGGVVPPPPRGDWGTVPVVLGMLIVVQGFETSRFMGAEFDAETRIRAMRRAQLISGAVYMLFFLLLSPLLTQLADARGVAGVIAVIGVVAAALPAALTLAACASQFSAAVADAIGDAGLIGDVTRGRVDARHTFPLIALIGIALLWSVDVFGVIALASRAFALFYMLQCLVAWDTARRMPERRGQAALFLGLTALAGAVVVFGVPAE